MDDGNEGDDTAPDTEQAQRLKNAIDRVWESL
jgi:hypothetical protein